MVAMLDVPMTLAGVSRINAQNAMAAAAAALAIGLPHRAVVKGLKTFVQDPEHNPGRANLFSIDGTVVMIDYAHNEAGMSGLVETLDGLRPRGGQVWLAICTAGDRTNEILRSFAFLAAVAVTRFRFRGRWTFVVALLTLPVGLLAFLHTVEERIDITLVARGDETTIIAQGTAPLRIRRALTELER